MTNRIVNAIIDELKKQSEKTCDLIRGLNPRNVTINGVWNITAVAKAARNAAFEEAASIADKVSDDRSSSCTGSGRQMYDTVMGRRIGNIIRASKEA